MPHLNCLICLSYNLRVRDDVWGCEDMACRTASINLSVQWVKIFFFQKAEKHKKKTRFPYVGVYVCQEIKVSHNCQFCALVCVWMSVFVCAKLSFLIGWGVHWPGIIKKKGRNHLCRHKFSREDFGAVFRADFNRIKNIQKHSPDQCLHWKTASRINFVNEVIRWHLVTVLKKKEKEDKLFSRSKNDGALNHVLTPLDAVHKGLRLSLSLSSIQIDL